MRFILALVLLVSSASLAAPPDSLAGTWNVMSTELADAMCPSEPGKAWAHQWLVSTNADGTLSVTVTGETSFPALAGTVDAKGKIVLSGFTEPKYDGGQFHSDSVWISLEVKGGQLVGTRRVLSLAETGVGKRKKVLVPCFLDMSVSAKR